jgi:hypothetical protein
MDKYLLKNNFVLKKKVCPEKGGIKTLQLAKEKVLY